MGPVLTRVVGEHGHVNVVRVTDRAGSSATAHGMLGGIADHIGDGADFEGLGGAVDHDMGGRVMTLATVSIMDTGYHIDITCLVVASGAGRSIRSTRSSGQEGVVRGSVMIREVVAMASGAAAASGRHSDSLAVRWQQGAVDVVTGEAGVMDFIVIDVHRHTSGGTGGCDMTR